MAGASQRRSHGTLVKTLSTASDDGTLADAPLDVTPVGVVDLEERDNSVQPASAQEGGTAHDEIAPLGKNVAEALQIVGKLEQLGLDKQEISLPKCIVLGQQSTGKSSVIEAISGIKTPRDTGTCTRCPLFIELQPSADPRGTWHAEIHLMRQYEVDLDPRRPYAEIEFQGWVPAAVQTTTPFAQTNDPDQLEYLIRCAQRATLSPLENPASFLDPTFDHRDIHKTLFSPNVVCISISKPGLPPLSFYDLPGIISFADDDEAFTVTLVKRLVTKYIRDPEALILLTSPLETDVENSVAAGIASRENVKNRCLGVLTKPDRLPVGESPTRLANILKGQHFAMGHGYFVVKNLNSDQIQQGLTHLDARRLEQEFFESVAPWSTDLQDYRSRFGTINLQQYLSLQLGNQVLSELPVIRRQIEDHLAVVEAELSRIPEIPLHTATRTVDDVLYAFASTVRSEIAGDHGFMTWSNTWEEIQRTMWDMLLQLKPTMATTGALDEGLYLSTLSGRSSEDSIVIDSDDDEESSGGPETPSKKRKHIPQPKREGQTPAPAPSPFRTPKKPIRKGMSHQPPGTPSLTQPDNIAALKRTYNLDEVALYISQNSKSRVPGQINPKVREEMMLAALEHWPRVITKFFDDLEQHLKQRMKGSELYTASFTIIAGLLHNHISQQRTTMVSESLEDELEGPHIFHKDIFKTDKAAMMERYAQARANARFKMYVKDAAARLGRDMTQNEKDKIRKDEKRMSRIQQEPYPDEVELVADITTYYLIAARRFHDSVTMRIESKFFKQLREKLRDQLQDELGIHDGSAGPYNAQRLLAESPERLARRNILVAKRKALLEGLQCFSEHFQRFQANNANGSAHGLSNGQRPAVHDDEMEDVRAPGLAIRGASRPAV
ncbi:P-loop containing nucleoside triphosphate hydrolase protein [Boeremia exigua]|uniref:P-loop containing nucleoside triphosphate hydrolase protein n=1 Tax=Boeremia exigua TaxID=749465 RepID=UPI001E8ED04B|nr:P-loop containing nucleoside triphosphate hydrolase protein [Boeremia exigua]KAH6629293.1 P-loop containing nucleoside triphosphate hydrolase protein [Boeremia exigua]